MAHDTALEGWPWTEDAHSMVEPTATALMALRMDGARDREREVQAVRMLLDRQLAGGGWNYGNTAVYGSQLDPLPDATGLALAALAGRVPAERVGASLAYLRDRCRDVRTPLSLGWICLGLAAWGRRVSEGRARIAECLDRERKRDSCATADLAILVLAGRSAETPLVENLRWGRKE